MNVIALHNETLNQVASAFSDDLFRAIFVFAFYPLGTVWLLVDVWYQFPLTFTLAL